MLPAPTDSVSGSPVFLNPDDGNHRTDDPSPTNIVTSGATYAPPNPTITSAASGFLHYKLVTAPSTLLALLLLMIHFT